MAQPTEKGDKDSQV
jgi:serine/threonine-protein kinase mTOR